MGKLTRILIVFATVLTIAAAVLSFLLFQRRNEFRGRANGLAKTLAEVVKAVDSDSGSDVGRAVSFREADPVTGSQEEGTLSWKAYHDAKGLDGQYAEFAGTLKKGRDHLLSLHGQRNVLADALADTAGLMGMADPETLGAALRNLADPQSAGKQAGDIAGLARAVKARDDAMVKTLLTCGTVIGHPLDEQSFHQRQQVMDDTGTMVLGDFGCQAGLTQFQGDITLLNTRANDYANTITQMIERIPKHGWQTDTTLVADEKEYVGAVTNLLNDFDDINQKLAELDDTKAVLAERTKALAEASDQLFKTRAELDKRQLEVAEQKREIERLKKASLVDSGAGARGMDPNLQGNVVQVNNDWNFVILDIGSDKVREKTTMLVARGDKLLGRVQISKVYPRFSIADVLPELRIGEISPMDRVILPKE